MKALLILDIQKDFTLPNGHFHEDYLQAGEIISIINELVENRGSFESGNGFP